jgi:uncharacterized membrane protein
MPVWSTAALWDMQYRYFYTMAHNSTIKRTPRFIWLVVILLVLIGIAMVARRTLTLAGVIAPVSPAGGVPFDTGFAKNPVITFLHILPGALFMILGPLQFVKSIREKYPRFHRWNGWIFIVCGYITGISAFIMSFLVPIGGMNEGAATVLFSAFFLIALTMALVSIVKRKVALHREWMLRAFAIGLAVSTIRPIVGLFFAFSGLAPQQFFGTAFWIGFTLHLVIAEGWINYTRSAI